LKNNNDAILHSGGLTTAFDRINSVPYDKGKYFRRVALFSHPEASTSKCEPYNIPLNGESFANSGYVIFAGIKQLIDSGVIREGITLIGHSGGCPVLLEAISLDVEQAKSSGKKYIKDAILLAPAGMLSHDVEAGAIKTFWPQLNDILNISGRSKRTDAEVESTRAQQIRHTKAKMVQH